VGNGDRSNGYGDEGGRQVMATMAMAMATTLTMATARRWQATKRPMARAARAMMTATKRAMVTVVRAMATVTKRAIVMDREGNVDNGKINGDSNK
jgi:hypothetical protein